MNAEQATCVSPVVFLHFLELLFFSKLLSDFLIFHAFPISRLDAQIHTSLFSSIWDSCCGGSQFIFYPPHLLLVHCTHGAVGPWGTLTTAYCNRLVICNLDWTVVTKRAFHVPASATCLPRGVITGLPAVAQSYHKSGWGGASWLDAAVTLILTCWVGMFPR